MGAALDGWHRHTAISFEFANLPHSPTPNLFRSGWQAPATRVAHALGQLGQTLDGSLDGMLFVGEEDVGGQRARCAAGMVDRWQAGKRPQPRRVLFSLMCKRESSVS